VRSSSLPPVVAKLVHRSEFPELTAASYVYVPAARMPPHRHDFPHFYLVIDGACRETNRLGVIDCGPSSLIFLPRGEAHSTDISPGGATLFGIELGPRWLDRLGEHVEPLPEPRGFRGGRPSWLAYQVFHELCQPDAVSVLAIEGLVLELLVELARDRRMYGDEHTPSWLCIVREFVHDHYAEHFTLDAVAVAAGVHPTHLARVFRRVHGCTIGDYVRRLRVEFCCQQIAGSRRGLAHIAVAAGFADQSHFTRSFKRVMGVTPGAYLRCVRRR